MTAGTLTYPVTTLMDKAAPSLVESVSIHAMVHAFEWINDFPSGSEAVLSTSLVVRSSYVIE
jgi:hypothetical protein